MAAATPAADPASHATQIALDVKRGNCREAIQLVNSDPAANDREAAFITARLLDEGICIQPDPENATHFFARAAELGDRRGVLDFASKIGLGVGADQDYQRAGDLCRAAGVDRDRRLSSYELGYACTLSGLTGKLLRHSLPTDAFKPAAGAVVQIEFMPASGKMRIRAVPHVATAVETGSSIPQPLIDAEKEIMKAWHDALSQVPRPDAARLDTQMVQLPIDVDMTLELERKTAPEQNPLFRGDIHQSTAM